MSFARLTAHSTYRCQSVDARNAARRIEPSPEGKRLGYRSITGATRDWRYLVRRKAERIVPNYTIAAQLEAR